MSYGCTHSRFSDSNELSMTQYMISVSFWQFYARLLIITVFLQLDGISGGYIISLHIRTPGQAAQKC